MYEYREAFLKLFHFLLFSRDQLTFVVDKMGQFPLPGGRPAGHMAVATLTVLFVSMPSGSHVVTQLFPLEILTLLCLFSSK